MNTCPVCAVMVTESATSCPQCGYDQVNRRYLGLTPEEEQALQAKLTAAQARWQARPPVELELPRLALEDIPPIAPPLLSDFPPLPPLSAEVTWLEAQLAGLEQALRALQAGNHPILAQGDAVIQAAKQLVQQTEADYRQQRPALSAQAIQVLEAALGKNPATDWGALYLLAPEIRATQLYGWVTAWRQQYQAQTQWAALQTQWAEQRQALEGTLQGRCVQLREMLLTAQRQDFAQIVAQFLAKRPQAEWMAVWVTLEAGLMQRRYRFFSKPGELFLLALPAQNPAPALANQVFTFKTPFVDGKGKIIRQEEKTAHYFTELLGKNKVPLEMVLIKGRQFQMGAAEGEKEARPSEFPQHWVTVPDFYLGKYPVTQAQYEAVMGHNPSHFKFKGAQRPVEQVNWEEAVAFCEAVAKMTGKAYRLPSEAQWEYACRVGTTTPFCYGETLTAALANYNANDTYGDGPKGKYWQETTEVGQVPPNGFGLYDMHGNVWEWVQDRWHGNYAGAPTDGSAWETNGVDNFRVLRGGSWSLNPSFLRAANRLNFTPDNRPSLSGGFRLVVSLSR